MKIPGYLLVLPTLMAAANAADCTAPNQQWFSPTAVDMMWSIRAWICPNRWWKSTSAGPDGGWCDKGGGLGPYWGKWTIAGMQSEQQCWDITEQIIKQCMWYDYEKTSYNGGSWAWGNIYAGGWFWSDPSKTCVHYEKRDDATEIDGPTNFTLADGTTHQVEERVWLSIGDDGVATLVREEQYDSN